MAKKVIVRTELETVQPEPYEEEIRQALAGSLDSIEKDLRLVDSQVPTPMGVIDILAIDGEKRLVMVEYVPSSKAHIEALVRALGYCAWSSDTRNLSYLAEFVRKQAGGLLGASESLNPDTRLILVGHQFEEQAIEAARSVPPDVSLVSFRLYSWGDDDLGLVPTIVLEKRKGEAGPEVAAAAFEAPYREVVVEPEVGEGPAAEAAAEPRPLEMTAEEAGFGVAAVEEAFEQPLEEQVEESLAEPPPTFHEIRVEPAPPVAGEELDQPLAGRPVEESLEVEAPEAPLFAGFGGEVPSAVEEVFPPAAEADVYPPVFEEVEVAEAPEVVSVAEPSVEAGVEEAPAVIAEAEEAVSAAAPEAVEGAVVFRQFESLREEFKEDFAAYRNYLERRLDQQMDELEAAVERRLSMPVDQLVQEARRRMPMGRTYVVMALIAAAVSAAVGYALLNLV